MRNNIIFMKKVLIPILIVAAIAIIYQKNLAVPNVYIICGGAVIFMFAMMKLSSKIPSKEKKNQDYDV